MNILLTGGTGFIGKAFLKSKNASNIYVFTRGPARKHENIQYINFDYIRDSGSLRLKLKELGSIDSLVHLGWEGLPDYSEALCKKNFDASLNLIGAVLEHNTKKLLIAGTCWEYGPCRGPQSENITSSNPSLFAQYKIELFNAAQKICSHYGAKLIWPRIFFAYGPGQRESSLIPSLILSISQHETPILRTPNAVNDFVHVDDVADALWQLISTPEISGIYNVGSGQPSVVGEIANFISTEFGREKIFEYLDHDFQNSGFWANIKLIKEKTKWSPKTDLRDGIRLLMNNSRP